MSVGSQQGQATVETSLLLSLLVTICLLAVQLIWIFWQQHTLQVATSYALRTGAVANGNKAAMEATLVSLLSSTQMPKLAAQQQPDLSLALTAYAAERLKFMRLGELRIRRPNKTTQTTFAELRSGYRATGLARPRHLQQWSEISVDHAQARYAAAPDKAAWLAARQLEIEVFSCLPLQIPVAATLLAAVSQWWNQHPASHFCHTRQVLSSYPLWPLSHRLSGPMLSGFYASAS